MPEYPYIPSTLTDLAVPLDSLRGYPGNARRGSVPEIAESLRQHGQYKPITVNGDVILAGNHTFQAMQSLPDATHIAATFVQVDDETAAKINLIDNKLSDDASYDVAALLAQLKELPDLTGTGYEPADLDALMETLDPLSAVPDIPPARTDALLFGTRRVPLTAAESAALEARLVAHIEETGTAYGFARAILRV